MAKVRTAALLEPLSWDADNVSVGLYFANNSQNLAYTSTTGWRRAGALGAPSDQSAVVTTTDEPVTGGAFNVLHDELVVGIEGTFQALVQDMNPVTQEFGQGTTLSNQYTADATSWTATVQASSTTSTIIVASGQTTGLAVGDVVRFTISTGNNAHTKTGIVDSITAATDRFTLKHALEEAPATGTTATRDSGFSQYHGGNTKRFYAAMYQLDFPKGEQHIYLIPKCTMKGGASRNFGNNVTTPLSGSMHGTSQTVGSLTGQVVCAITHATYRNG